MQGPMVSTLPTSLQNQIYLCAYQSESFWQLGILWERIGRRSEQENICSINQSSAHTRKAKQNSAFKASLDQVGTFLSFSFYLIWMLLNFRCALFIFIVSMGTITLSYLARSLSLFNFCQNCICSVNINYTLSACSLPKKIFCFKYQYFTCLK